jgi:hypothetical protein
MTDRVFEDELSFGVAYRSEDVEVYVFDDGNVKIEVTEDAGWDSQRANFTLTAEEATLLKEFLIRKGY